MQMGAGREGNMKHEEFLSYMKSTVEGWRDSAQYESLKTQYQGFLVTIENFRQQSVYYDLARRSMHELLIEFSKAALQALALINAGGIFVIMTIVSGLLSAGGKWIVVVPWVAANSKYFVVGLSAAILTILLSYLAQTLYNEGLKIEGRFAHVGAIVVGLFSFVSFVYGASCLMAVFVSVDFLNLVNMGI